MPTHFFLSKRKCNNVLAEQRPINAFATNVSFPSAFVSEQTPTLVYYSGYEESQLENLMCRICQLSLRAGTGKLTAVKTKYSSSKLMRISKLPQLDSQLVHERSSRVTTQS